VLYRIHRVPLGRELRFLGRDRARTLLLSPPAMEDHELREADIRRALTGLAPPDGHNAPGLLHGDFCPGNTFWQPHCGD
jgi:Ser/Thr protein kinase RdoA (MazF antagonist)